MGRQLDGERLKPTLNWPRQTAQDSHSRALLHPSGGRSAMATSPASLLLSSFLRLVDPCLAASASLTLAPRGDKSRELLASSNYGNRFAFSTTPSDISYCRDLWRGPTLAPWLRPRESPSSTLINRHAKIASDESFRSFQSFERCQFFNRIKCIQTFVFYVASIENNKFPLANT